MRSVKLCTFQASLHPSFLHASYCRQEHTKKQWMSNFHSLFLSVFKTGSVTINIYEAGKEFEFIVPLESDTMALLIYSNYCPTLQLVVSRTCHLPAEHQTNSLIVVSIETVHTTCSAECKLSSECHSNVSNVFKNHQKKTIQSNCLKY